MPLTIVIATKKMGSTDKLAHAHLHCLNKITNYVNLTGIMYFWHKYAIRSSSKDTQLLLCAHIY